MWRVGEVGADWRRTVGDSIWRMLPRTWQPAYDSDARVSLDQALSRMATGMTRGGELAFSECKRDGIISIEHVDPSLIEQRGDRRYGSTNLAEFLEKNPFLDLVPIICGMKAGQRWVLDGHHRLRAYELVGRPVLALMNEIRVGSGLISFAR